MQKQDFTQLVEQYERLVYTICYQLSRNHHTAQDLSQETFLSVYTHLDSCPADNPKAWIACIATNKAKDHLKSAYSRRVLCSDEAADKPQGSILFNTAELPHAAAEEKEGTKVIVDEISGLKQPYHQVASLYYLKEHSVNEIATTLGRPERTVQTQLYRAKLQLRQRLAPCRQMAQAN